MKKLVQNSKGLYQFLESLSVDYIEDNKTLIILDFLDVTQIEQAKSTRCFPIRKNCR